MKKFFTLAATLFAAICMNASDITIALTSMTAGENSYAYDGDEIKAKNNNVYIALPGANVQGSITIKGSSNKSDRFIYIYGEGGTVKDESRAIQMKSDGETIAFTASDIILVSEVPYLLFSTADDFKFKKFNYTYEEGKAIISQVETLTGAAINGVALSDTQMATLNSALTLNLAAEYAEAPTVTFTVQTATYYEGEETPSIKSKDIDVVAALNPDGKWQAQQTVGEKTYTITAVKPATVTITYMDGATVLGEETVKKGETSTKHAEFETKPLATFEGWFKDAELTVPADLTAAVNADQTLYGKFVKAYAQSLNIEQLVVTNGKGYGIKDALTANGYAYENIDALDSLNNEKGAARNEPYLGLKIKKQGGYVACNVKAGSTIRVKFGYVENAVLAIAGNDTLNLTPANKTLNVLEFPAAADTYVKLQTTSDKTVVIKQIMVDAAITNVMYKITYAAAENGEVSGWTVAYPGEEVVMNITSNEGYTLTSLTYNGTEMVQSAPGAPISFTMPAEAVTVAASFGDIATGIGNADAAVKAVKVIRDGKLFIEKNGVLYNAQGVIVK